MFDGKRVLAVVPARGGSQGIKLKNLRKVGGVPLVAICAKTIGDVEFIDRAVCSTDHEEIARVAEAAGLAVPFRRPENIAGARIGDFEVLIHALEQCEKIDGVTYDIILMLQPTSPSRTAGHIHQSVEQLCRGDFDAVWTVSETDSKAHPLKQLTIDDTGRLDYYDPAGSKIIARQQLEPVYHRNGIAYAFTRSCLVDQRTTKGDKTGFVIINGPVANIDTELDLKWAELLVTEQE